MANNKSDVSSLTAPIASLFQMWKGSEYTDDEKNELKDNIKNIKNNARISTSDKRKQIQDITNKLNLDEARKQRQLDAVFTASGTAAGGGLGFWGASELDKALVKKNNELIEKVRNLVSEVYGKSKKGSNVLTQNALDSMSNALPADMRTNSLLKSKIKQYIQALQPKLTGLKGKYKYVDPAIGYTDKALQSVANKIVPTADKVKEVFSNLPSGANTFKPAQADALKDLAQIAKTNNIKKLLTSGKQLSMIGGKRKLLMALAGALTTGLTVAGISNYKGSRDTYNNIEDSIKK